MDDFDIISEFLQQVFEFVQLNVVLVISSRLLCEVNH